MALEAPATQKTFDELGLSETALKAVAKMGFTHATPIQAEAIPLVIEGLDIIGQARTGTGKTTAFGLPIIEGVSPKKKGVQALVLCPTRELAIQVAEEMERMADGRDVKILSVYGGAKMEPQIRDLKQGVEVVVGTPGRVMDHMRRGNLSLRNLDYLVLDEADRMLDMGFIEDMEWILSQAPKRGQRQMMLFSATLPYEITDIAERFMTKPKTVRTVKEVLTVPDIEQVYYLVGRKNKLWAMSRIIEHEKPNLMLVFCATKRMVDRLTEQLSRYDYGAEAIHGDLSQSRREKVLERFKAGKIHVLVATDVAARGLDIDDITHVVNYDLPENEPEVYVHRIGRTGRAGRSGKAISFVSKGDKRQLTAIERLIGMEIDRAEVPGEESALEKDQAGKGGKGPREKIRKVIDWDHVADRYGNVHFEIDVGKADGATMVKVHSMVCKATNVPEYAIGHVEVDAHKTRFDVPKDSAHRVIRTLGRHTWKGRAIKVHFLSEQH